jgi:hypothetical protein
MTYTTEYETKDGKTVRKETDAEPKKTVSAETPKSAGTASGKNKE